MDGEEFTYAMDQTGIVYYNPAQGKLYGLKAGTVNITFMVKGQPSISKTITITVTPLSTQYDVVIGDSAPIKVKACIPHERKFDIYRLYLRLLG